MNSFATGFSFLSRGWAAILRSPRLLMLAFLPMVIDILLLVALLSYGFPHIYTFTVEAINYLMPQVSGFWSHLSFYILFAFFGVGFLAFAAYVCLVLAMVINAPFYILMAEMVLIKSGHQQPKPFNVKNWLSTSFRMLFVSLKKALLFAVLGVVIFFFSFLPVLNILGALLALLIIAYDCSDYLFEVLELDFRARLGFFFRHLLVFFGMGLILIVPLLIPGGLLLIMPGAVVGAAEILGPLAKGVHVDHR